MHRHRRFRKNSRRGNIVVLTAFIMVALLAFLAFAVDLGYLALARTELQRSADSSAMAATWELIDSGQLSAPLDLSQEIVASRTKASAYAQKNIVCATAPSVDANSSNDLSGDVIVGYLSNPFDSTCEMTFDDPDQFNAIRVRVRKSTELNGEVPYFFARILGLESTGAEAQATAALLKNFGGFKASTNGENLAMLPFALDLDTWNNMLNGGGNDNWRWNEELKAIESGADGIREINLYPQGTGCPGNRGTVDIGGCNNSTADIARQITDGISAEDLEHHGGKLEFDENGELELNGDTGISAGVKDELASIKGQPRIIPIFESVSGPGNNAQYVIVQFAGIRILDVKLTGSMSSKRVTIQPAKIFVNGGIPSNTETSHFVYSPVWLVR